MPDVLHVCLDAREHFLQIDAVRCSGVQPLQRLGREARLEQGTHVRTELTQCRMCLEDIPNVRGKDTFPEEHVAHEPIVVLQQKQAAQITTGDFVHLQFAEYEHVETRIPPPLKRILLGRRFNVAVMLVHERREPLVRIAFIQSRNRRAQIFLGQASKGSGVGHLPSLPKVAYMSKWSLPRQMNLTWPAIYARCGYGTSSSTPAAPIGSNAAFHVNICLQ